MSFHMGSCFLGFFCMIQVVCSLPVTALIFKKILGINYMCALHIFTLILVMGIGADNIFVFYDHWRYTRHIKIMRKRYPLRMAYTFRKAGSAMAVTSVTTAASFLATCISPVMPIISFGLFAAIVVFVNFLMIILTVPLIIMVYEVDIRPNFQCCRAFCKFLKFNCCSSCFKKSDIVSDIGTASSMNNSQHEGGEED